MKKLITTGLVLVVALVVVSQTRLWSYICTLGHQAQTAVEDAIPTPLELQRVRLEIGKMDNDIKAVESTVAARMADVAELRRKIDSTRAALTEQKKSLLVMTADLEGSPEKLTYGGKDYTAEQVRRKLNLDFVSYKQAETGLKTRERELQEKERALEASNTQREKLLALKQEATAVLAQLEADQALLEAAQVGTNKVEVNTSRSNDIKTTLEKIRHRQEKERAVIALEASRTASENIPVLSRGTGETTPQDIRQYLEQPQTTGTTVRKSE